MVEQYNEAHQELLITFLLSSGELFARSRNIIKPSYFDRKYQKTVKYILNYADEQKSLPTKQHVISETSLEFDVMTPDDVKPHTDWFLENIELFCRHKAMEDAVESSVDLLEKGNYSVVQDKVRDALLISLTRDLGLEIFKDPVSFINDLRDKDNVFTTGWKDVDDKLYGGFNPGELNIFAGAPGTGKSLFLQNIALNWVQKGKEVIYLTLELSEELTGMRLNAMITGKKTRDVFRDTEDIGLTIKTMHKVQKWGNLIIKFMPIGTTANDIKTYLKEYEIQKGKKPDCLVVDYLDLLHPNNKRVNPSDLFVKDKYVSEELRSLLQENQLLNATASQLNRCLTLDTVVEEKNKGEIPIKDVNIGDMLLSNNGFKEVQHIYPIINQAVYEIQTKTGKIIKCSANHLFPTINGSLKNIAMGLSVGDIIHVKKRNNIIGKK